MVVGVWRAITDVYGGKITRASYRLFDRTVTVRTSLGSKTAQIGGNTPDRLARTLLREMVTQCRQREMGLEVWREITAEYNGRAVKGSFKFIDGVVNLRTPRGSKTMQSIGHTPEQMAKQLLRELAREQREKDYD